MNAVAARVPRRGIALFELLVAFSILAVLASVSAGLLVRSGRLLGSARHQRVAVEELANLMEGILAMAPAERDAFLAAPALPDAVAARLPGAALTATADPPGADGARRVVLALEWNEPGRRGRPLRLAGWLPGLPGEVTR